MLTKRAGEAEWGGAARTKEGRNIKEERDMKLWNSFPRGGVGSKNLTGFKTELDKCREERGGEGRLPIRARGPSVTGSSKYLQWLEVGHLQGGLRVATENSLSGVWLMRLTHMLRV